jgi:hypothetical protein
VIQAPPGATFESFLQGAPTGLVGTLTWRLIDPSDGSIEIAASTSGITEPATGTYRREAVAPTTRDTYLIVWKNGATEVTEELDVGYSSDYRPTVADVGALIRARTKDVTGNEPGTFNANTRPTGEQVEMEIDNALDEVAGHLGEGPMADSVKRRAQRTTALYAAMLVELSYFPEQIADDQSPYDRLKELYDQAIAGLAASVTTDAGDIQGFGSVMIASPTRSAALGQVEALPWPGEWH